VNARSWPAAPQPPSADVLTEVLDAAKAVVDAAASTDSLDVHAEPISGVPVVTGSLPTWDDVVRAGHAAATAWVKVRTDNQSDVVVDISSESSEPVAAEPTRVLRHTGELPDSVDVVVIGAGICGMMTAYYLVRAGLSVAVLDAASRIGEMTTSWNNGMVHPGHDPKPGTLKALLNIKGNADWSPVMQSLGLAFQRRPSLVVGFGEADNPRLDNLLSRARANGVPGAEVISGDRAREIEPRLSSSIGGALYLPTTASIDPVEVAEGLAVKVRGSGGSVSLMTEVSAITVDAGRVTGVQVGERHIAAPLVINAAGVYADTLSATAGSRRYSIHPRRGSLVLFDPGADARYLNSIWQVPGAYSKGCGMTARPSGFTTGGPTAVEQQSKISLPPTQAEIDDKIYPEYPLGSIVHVGSDVRAVTYCEDFIIGPAPGVIGLVDVAGTQSPAVASAPAIAGYVVDALGRLGYIPDPN
jgi:glycerol-3-phosphate dehydrogenase